MSPAHSGDLLNRSRAGDRAALEALLQQHLPGLRAFTRLRMSPLLRGREESADLVQSACCAVITGLDEFEYRGEAAFRGWLYTVVFNKLLEHEREARTMKRDLRREVPLDRLAAGQSHLMDAYARVLSPSGELCANERLREIEAAFDALPDDFREVLTLSRIARMPRAAIAAQLGKSEASVRSLLSRALVQLAVQLDLAKAAHQARSTPAAPTS